MYSYNRSCFAWEEEGKSPTGIEICEDEGGRKNGRGNQSCNR